MMGAFRRRRAKCTKNISGGKEEQALEIAVEGKAVTVEKGVRTLCLWVLGAL